MNPKLMRGNVPVLSLMVEGITIRVFHYKLIIDSNFLSIAVL
jgi:hypothetical protein